MHKPLQCIINTQNKKANISVEAICSSVYINTGTHSFDRDGMIYYPEYLFSGYAALFREADRDLVFCCYIIPGGTVMPADLKELHHRILTEYKPVVSAIGAGAEVEKMNEATVRSFFAVSRFSTVLHT